MKDKNKTIKEMIVIEIKSAEGGNHAKELVRETVRIYNKAAVLEGL